MRSRIPAIAHKELLHIVRDWRTLAMAFGLPLIMLFIFSYAITFDVRNLLLAVADADNSSFSRALRDRFVAGGCFLLVAQARDPRELEGLLESGAAQVLVVIPRGFARALELNQPAPVQVIIDGSENNTASIADGYIQSIIQTANLELIGERLTQNGVSGAGFPPIAADARVWFNPELRSTNTIVPGLISMILTVVAALLTSLTVVRERESGSLESLIATPVRRHEIIIGKMIPYLVISMFDCFLIAGAGHYVAGVPFNGSIVLYTLASFAFSLACLAIGLMASVVATNQLFANQVVMMTTQLPSMILSGFMFPIKAMPDWVQLATYAVPSRYFITITRGLMLKNQPAAAIAGPALLLLGFGAALIVLAVASFRKKI
jgi:ABC-2 type transport system permease protein